MSQQRSVAAKRATKVSNCIYKKYNVQKRPSFHEKAGKKDDAAGTIKQRELKILGPFIWQNKANELGKDVVS